MTYLIIIKQGRHEAFVFNNSHCKSHKGSNQHWNVQIVTPSDVWLLYIKKLVKVIVSPSKATLRFMAPEKPM